MFCPKCGTQNQDASVFCKECGASLQQQGGNVAATATAAGAPAVAQAAGQVASQAANAINNVPGMDKLAKKNKKLPVIIAAVVLVVIVALIIFGVTQCMGGGNLKPGTYTMKSLSSSSSNTLTVTVNKDKTIAMTQDGDTAIYEYKKSGSKGGSNLYELTLQSTNGIQAQYDKDGYCTNASQLSGAYSSSSLPVKMTTTLMIPKGGTDGKVTGDWGLAVSATTARDTSYEVMACRVTDSGTMTAVSKYGSDALIPELDYDSLIAVSSNSPVTLYWKSASANSYMVSGDSDFPNRTTVVITMP